MTTNKYHGHTATLTCELDLGRHGGAAMFFADLDGDGRPEIITYQGPGIFGARKFRDHPKFKPFLPGSTAISVLDMAGKRLWTWGQPNQDNRPYLAHAAESCVTIADIDGDGNMEIIFTLGDTLVMLDGRNGREKLRRALPDDCFHVIHALGRPTRPHTAALVAKNSESDFNRHWPHGQPVIGLNAALEPVWGPLVVPGGGHNVMTIDMPDGRAGYLIGHCAVTVDGQTAWMTDSIQPEKIDARTQHVDDMDCHRDAGGRRVFALAAGTPCGYVVEDGGKTVFRVQDAHVQGTAFGQFLPAGNTGGPEWQTAFYNCHDDLAIALYDARGNRLWRKAVAPRAPDMSILDRSWPSGRQGRFHGNRPIKTVEGPDHDWIAFDDGGWPWGMDGTGAISLRFPAPGHLPAAPWRQFPAAEHLRLNDLGFGYSLRVVEMAHGKPGIMIYDRRYLWRYTV